MMISLLDELGGDSRLIVLDASVVINLIATKRIARILESSEHSYLIPTPVLAEVPRDPINKKPTTQLFQEIDDSGLITISELDGDEVNRVIELTSADLGNAVGIGEASVIACAERRNGIAALDDAKARNIALRYKLDALVFTLDLLSQNSVYTAMELEMPDVLYSALLHARMRVPIHYEKWITKHLSPDQLSQCSSLRKIIRPSGSTYPSDPAPGADFV